MCKRYKRTFQATTDLGGYEGETVQLDARGVERAEACRWMKFPWWSLWLIWPLIGLFKWTGALIAPIAEFVNRPIILEVSLLPLLLIGLGIVFVLYAQRNEGE